MATKPSNADRGGLAEEAIREYFSNLGAFTVRGVPLKAENDDVSDVDIWAYTRVSAVSKNIAIVDIKNKRRGKPFERAVWVRGLQAALRSDEAFIATQGAKTSVYEFAQKLGVKVISGNLFDALVRKYSTAEDRMPHEELDEKWKDCFVANRSVKSIVDGAKSHLAFGISFSSLNEWIDEAGILLMASIERESGTGPISRACYLVMAFVAIGVDYLSKSHALSDSDMRAEYFRKGLIFGNGSDDGRRFIDFSEALITEHLDTSGAAAAKVRTGFYRSIEKMPVGGLVENFSRASGSADMFRAALQLEKTAFNRNAKAPHSWDGVEGKVVVGLLADYFGVPRRAILGDQAVNRLHATKDQKESNETTDAKAVDDSSQQREPQGKFDV